VSQLSFQELKRALDEGGDVNEDNGEPGHPLTPLALAVVLKRCDLARLLISRGARLEGYAGYRLDEIAFMNDDSDTLALLRESQEGVR
jgi:hypothetical protein